jgi:hypothetical protein
VRVPGQRRGWLGSPSRATHRGPAREGLEDRVSNHEDGDKRAQNTSNRPFSSAVRSTTPQEISLTTFSQQVRNLSPFYKSGADSESKPKISEKLVVAVLVVRTPVTLPVRAPVQTPVAGTGNRCKRARWFVPLPLAHEREKSLSLVEAVGMWATCKVVQADGGSLQGYPQERHLHQPAASVFMFLAFVDQPHHFRVTNSTRVSQVSGRHV